jgi:hypothetical protein
MTAHRALLATIALGLGAAACSSTSTAETLPPSGVICTGEFRMGLVVKVVDSLTGGPPPQATLIATTSGARDSIGPLAPFKAFADSAPAIYLSAAGERPGTYSLFVTAPGGYRDWRKDGVVVTKDACHVQTVKLEARLQRF